MTERKMTALPTIEEKIEALRVEAKAERKKIRLQRKKEQAQKKMEAILTLPLLRHATLAQERVSGPIVQSIFSKVKGVPWKKIPSDGYVYTSEITRCLVKIAANHGETMTVAFPARHGIREVKFDAARSFQPISAIGTKNGRKESDVDAVLRMIRRAANPHPTENSCLRIMADGEKLGQWTVVPLGDVTQIICGEQKFIMGATK